MSNVSRLLSVAAIASVAAALIVAGCDPQKTSDSAPYGAAASPSAAPSAPAVPDMTGAPIAQANPAPVPAASAGAPKPAPPAAGGAPAAPPMPGGANGPAPFMGMADPTAPLTPTPEMDKAIADAEKGGDKKTIAAAYATRGTFRMKDEKAGARVKYRAALEDYRAALKADPKNAEATTNKEMIENIYRSMGRPIPGEEAKGRSAPAGTKK